MNISCTSSDQFIINQNNYQYITDNECINRGKYLIENYLSDWNLSIRPLNFEDVNNLYDNNDLLDDICGLTMADNLGFVIDEIKEEADENPSLYNSEEGLRITYILCPLNDQNEILGIVSAVINYRDPSLELSSFGNFYSQVIENINSIYVEIGCSNQNPQYKQYVTGTNYFIRVYILLIAFEIINIELLWGSASGETSESKQQLHQLHIKRSCTFVEGTDIYHCDPITFINTFFERLYNRDLLKYTNRYTK